jgi:hypothetical protein
VAGGIVLRIRLGLHDAADEPPGLRMIVDEVLPEQILRDLNRRSVEKGRR